MGELLQNILTLRKDIDKLIEFSNEAAYEYCELAIKVADDKEDISMLSSERRCVENYIRDFKCKKSLLYSFPIGMVFSIPYLTYQIIFNWYSLTFGSSLVQILSAAAMGMTISVASACLLLYSNKFESFLVKKYPSFKYMNEKVNNLKIEIKTKEEELEHIEKIKEEKTNAITNNEEILERKKDELYKLEQDYFNNIKNNHITNGTVYNLSSAGKKRTLTRGNDYY